MRKLLSSILSGGVLVIALVVATWLLPNYQVTAKPTTIEQQVKYVKEADAALAKTETNVGSVATELKAASDAIASGELPADATANELAELDHHLGALGARDEELGKDISACETTRAQLGESMERELAAISDPVLRRRQERKWQRAFADSEKQVTLARQVRVEIVAAKAQAEDLKHIGNALRITDTLKRSTADLASQLGQAREAAASFSKRTEALLASVAGEPADEATNL